MKKNQETELRKVIREAFNNALLKNIKEQEEAQEHKPVSKMSYSEQEKYIKEKYVPYIKNVSKTWNWLNSGDSIDELIPWDNQIPLLKQFYKENSDFTEEELGQKTKYEVSDEFMEIKNKETGEVLKEVKGSVGNTYNENYLGPTGLVYSVFAPSNDKEPLFLYFRPHMGGDIRTNYGYGYIMQGTNEQDLLERFHEDIIAGSMRVNIEFGDGSYIVFNSSQDFDVNYYEVGTIKGGQVKGKQHDIFNKEPSEVKSESIADTLNKDFESFSDWTGDDFVENIVSIAKT